MTFIIKMINLGEGRCLLKHLHVLHKHRHAEESLEVIILHIHLDHRIDGQAPFESGCFHIEMLLLIYSLFCKIQKMLRNIGCSLLRGVKLQRACLTSVSEISVEAR